jgi:glyoxylate reductase
VIRAAPRLKLIANYGRHRQHRPGRRRDARNRRDTHARRAHEATADLTLALLLALTRRVLEGDRMVRSARFIGWAPDLLLGTELKGKIFGIFGRDASAARSRAAPAPSG